MERKSNLKKRNLSAISDCMSPGRLNKRSESASNGNFIFIPTDFISIN